MHRYVLVAAFLLAVPLSALAGTVERTMAMRPGQETTLPLSSPARAHVSDTDVISAKVADGDSVKVVAKSQGFALLFLHGDRGLSVFRVEVGTSSEETRQAAEEKARQSCDSFEQTRQGLTVFIGSAECHQAVQDLSPFLTADELAVRFNEVGLRAQLAAQEARLQEDHPELADRLQLGYIGANLRVAGSLDGPDQRDAVLRSLWHATAGRMLLDLGHLEVGTAGMEVQ